MFSVKGSGIGAPNEPHHPSPRLRGRSRLVDPRNTGRYGATKARPHLRGEGVAPDAFFEVSDISRREGIAWRFGRASNRSVNERQKVFLSFATSFTRVPPAVHANGQGGL